MEHKENNEENILDKIKNKCKKYMNAIHTIKRVQKAIKPEQEAETQKKDKGEEIVSNIAKATYRTGKTLFNIAKESVSNLTGILETKLTEYEDKKSMIGFDKSMELLNKYLSYSTVTCSEIQDNISYDIDKIGNSINIKAALLSPRVLDIYDAYSLAISCDLADNKSLSDETRRDIEAIKSDLKSRLSDIIHSELNNIKSSSDIVTGKQTIMAVKKGVLGIGTKTEPQEEDRVYNVGIDKTNYSFKIEYSGKNVVSGEIKINLESKIKGEL